MCSLVGKVNRMLVRLLNRWLDWRLSKLLRIFLENMRSKVMNLKNNYNRLINKI